LRWCFDVVFLLLSSYLQSNVAQVGEYEWAILCTLGLVNMQRFSGLSAELVAVYSVTDQRLKQAVPFPGGRHVGCYDGTVLLASSNQVTWSCCRFFSPSDGGRDVG
jgi:hypothetical protein